MSASTGGNGPENSHRQSTVVTATGSAIASALLTLAHQEPHASTAHAADIADVAASTTRAEE